MRIAVLILITAFLTSNISLAQFGHIIPRPLQAQAKPGYFPVHQQLVIYTDRENLQTAGYLQTYLDSFYHIAVIIKNAEAAQTINGAIILRSGTIPAEKESYRLTINHTTIKISGSGAGVFYGVQSLLQLLPPKPDTALAVPCGTVYDKPRFAWRGLSLDVSRHFFSVAEVRKYIDIMAHYKFNVFHWHLTDDEGWRIEIDKYPRLTSVGSKMNVWAKEGKFRPLSNIIDSGSEGFYTKSQIRDIVQYAQDHFITVVPEIEMPGHCEAAVYAYPELGCQDSTGEKQKQRPFARTRMYDPSEQVFAFLEDVLNEVMPLFPGDYFHIGGDEAEMADWLKSPAAIALMKKEGLKNEREIQSYFIKRIEKFLLSKGKKLVGWDEILEGGLAPSATVMSWRGEEGGIAAAKMHHPVVMTPLPYVYFDAPQSDDTLEPVGWNYPLSWQHVYAYEPSASALSKAEAGYVLGAQGNIWAEKIPSQKHLEYMVYPRALALAEDCWTEKKRKDIHAFTKNLHRQYALFRLWKLNARMPDAEGMQAITTNKKQVVLELTHPLQDTKIYYTTDGSFPVSSSALYIKPILLNLPAMGELNIKTMAVSSLANQPRYQAKSIRSVAPDKIPGRLKNSKPGLRYASYQKQIDPEHPDSSAPDNAGITAAIRLPADSLAPGFHAVVFSGYLRIDREDDYTYSIEADGETVLYLDHKKVIDNEGYHGTTAKEALLHLRKGYYAFRLVYDNENDGKELRLLLHTNKEKNKRITPVLLYGTD